MYISEKLKVEDYFYPFSQKINPILYDIVSNLPCESRDDRNVQSQKMVRWIKNDKMYAENKQLFLLENWISQLINKDFKHKNLLVCDEMWGVLYEYDVEIVDHSHRDSLYSCSYYVSAPPGSSPLIFTTSNHKIKAQEGKLIIFDGRLQHHIPKSKRMKDKKRCVIDCNFRSK